MGIMKHELQPLCKKNSTIYGPYIDTITQCPQLMGQLIEAHITSALQPRVVCSLKDTDIVSSALVVHCMQGDWAGIWGYTILGFPSCSSGWLRVLHNCFVPASFRLLQSSLSLFICAGVRRVPIALQI